jgi:histidinol-phosphatase (PHP family)
MGIAEVGFSEHVDYEPKDWGYGYFNYDKYSYEINGARELFKNKLIIRKGVEIDYQYCFEDEIAEWLQNKEFDFVIGSVHYLNHEIINQRLVMNRDMGKIYNAYFGEVTQSIKSRLFDVIGHFDIVNRFIDKRKINLKSGYFKGVRKILKQIIENNVYLEINSKGVRYNYRDLMPSKEIIEEYFEAGGQLISVGSDAHSKEDIGSGIRDILTFLEKQKKGYKLLFE